MNTYETSYGERLPKGTIDRNIRRAKEIKVNAEHGRIKSELSGSYETPIDISHIISVKYCQETKRSELAWHQSNLRFLTRKEHEKHDALTNEEREKIYKLWNKQYI